jgi:CCR4-NOT transcription complex subunit 4
VCFTSGRTLTYTPLFFYHPEISVFLCTVAPARSPSPLLSSSDFPALTAQPPQPPSASSDLPVESRTNGDGTQVDEKAVRRAEKKAAAAERAVERAKRRAEKEREKAEKKAERERLERERKELERVEKEQEQERLEREKAEKQQREREKARELQQEAAKAEASKKANTSGKSQKAEVTSLSSASTRRSNARSVPVPKSTPTPVPASTVSTSPPSQGPLLSKMPKKNRPVTKPIRIPKEGESTPETPSVLTSAAASDAPQFTLEKSSTSVLDTNSTSSRGQSVERMTNDPTTVGELLAEIERQYPMMDLVHHPFFDVQKLNPASKMTLEYGPLAHALSALSVGGGSFANNMPSGSVDNAVSSFQQLLETLTQTISDLLRLLPRTTWDDSSSFDGVLRDMLKGDDFLDDGSEDHRSHTGAGKDEVAALTLALERRARWMEVQLSKLEELHRDINTAAVRAVLAFNDSGWDPHGFAPRTGGTLQKFDVLGTVQTKGGGLRPMTAEELEEKLIVAKEAAVFAETEVREIMGRIQATLLPTGAVPESLICLM